MAFNLRNIKSFSSFDYEIKDQNGDPTGIVFTIAGPTHPVQKAIKAEAQERMALMMEKKGKPDIKRVLREQEDRKIEILTRCTLGWTGYVDDNGNEVPFTEQAAKDLYSDPEMAWLVDAVDEAMGNRDFFIKTVGAK